MIRNTPHKNRAGRTFCLLNILIILSFSSCNFAVTSPPYNTIGRIFISIFLQILNFTKFCVIFFKWGSYLSTYLNASFKKSNLSIFWVDCASHLSNLSMIIFVYSTHLIFFIYETKFAKLIK